MNQDAANQAATSPKTTDDIENLLDDTEAAIAAAQTGTPTANPSPAAPNPSDRSAATAPPAAAAYQFDDLQDTASNESPHSLDLLGDVQLDLRIELGRTVMRLDEVLRLRSGSVVALDKLAGDPVDIYINGRLIAHGEVLVMNDHFCVRVTELAGSSSEIQ